MVNADSNQDQGNTRRPLTFTALEEEQESMDVDLNEEETQRNDGQKDDDTHQSDQAEDDEDEQIAPEELWESIEFKKWKESSLEQRAKVYVRFCKLRARKGIILTLVFLLKTRLHLLELLKI